MALLVLLVFGLASSTILITVGVHRAVTRRYPDRSGVVLEGQRAVRAGVLVAVIGAFELALTLVLWSAGR